MNRFEFENHIEIGHIVDEQFYGFKSDETDIF